MSYMHGKGEGMERYAIYAKRDGGEWERQHTAKQTDPSDDRLPLDAAEQFAYGACIARGADAVRLEGTSRAFAWHRDDDGRPGEGQGGRCDAMINGRWWQYRPACAIHDAREAAFLAGTAQHIPAVQAVHHGGPNYQRDH